MGEGCRLRGGLTRRLIGLAYSCDVSVAHRFHPYRWVVKQLAPFIGLDYSWGTVASSRASLQSVTTLKYIYLLIGRIINRST
uniref:Uncharacterized protein n=1 Tax=Picea glauca TaxID=3330 RepID=A0A117NJ49_PICGL|nr:hypothetical protein ABT39_MTgene868 [Picea glauca]QHR89375.1 hypothetical protein Q903MT_gene3396 [Picea sitchensis]